MNHATEIAVVRGLQAGVLYMVVGATLGCASADPASRSNKFKENAPPATGSEEMVDCLLPGQIRRLDESVTYLSERRLVRTTQADCNGRGGTIQPSERPMGSSSESAK